MKCIKSSIPMVIDGTIVIFLIAKVTPDGCDPSGKDDRGYDFNHFGRGR